MPKAWGGCFLVFDPVLVSKTKKQPPARFARRPPSQEGSLLFYEIKNTTGNDNLVFTFLPFTFPGIHLGIFFTTLSASCSRP